MTRSLCVALIGSILLAGAAVAQTGGITGTVVDVQGNPVADARVSLWVGDDCSGRVMTDANGAYEFTDVPVGIYRIHAGKPRVGQGNLENVEVLPGEVTELPTIVLVGKNQASPDPGVK